MTWVLIALAGGAGAVSRYLVDQRVGAWTGARRARRTQRTHLEIPWGTMVVNVSACLLIGLVAALTAGETYRVLAHTLLMVGVSWLAACAGLALGGLAA